MAKPRGGNKHKSDIGDLWKQYADCQTFFDVKCKQRCQDPPEREKSTFRCRDLLIPIGLIVLYKAGKIGIGCIFGGPIGGLIMGAT